MSIPEAFAPVLALDGIWLLCLGVALAGLVRGFSGFGTAMVYLPFAGQVLEPVWTLITLLVIDLFGPVPALPRAVREANRRDLLYLAAGLLFGLPLGVYLLTAMAQDQFRLAVSGITLALLVLLVAGFRYRGAVGCGLLGATGAVGGVLGGSVGLPGPPAIMLYMARPLPPQTIRATIMIYLLLCDMLMIALFAWRGLFEWTPLLIGLVITPIYFCAIWLGSWLFDRGRAVVYRWVAYVIIAGSAIGGLPVWS